MACGCRGRTADVTEEEEIGTVDESDLGGSDGRRLFLRPAITKIACVPTVTLAESELGKTFLQRMRWGGIPALNLTVCTCRVMPQVPNVLKEHSELITGENGALPHLGAVYEVVCIQLQLLDAFPWCHLITGLEPMNKGEVRGQEEIGGREGGGGGEGGEEGDKKVGGNGCKNPPPPPLPNLLTIVW